MSRLVKVKVPKEAKFAIRRAKYSEEKHMVFFTYRAPYSRESYPTRKYCGYAWGSEKAGEVLIKFSKFDITKTSYLQYIKRVYFEHFARDVKHGIFLIKLHIRKWHAKHAGELECFCTVTNYCSDRQQEYKEKGLYACADCPLKAQCTRMKYFGEKNKPIITHGPLMEDEAFINSHRYEYGLGDNY